MGGVLFLDPIVQPFEAKQARASNYVSSDSRHQRADKEKKAIVDLLSGPNCFQIP